MDRNAWDERYATPELIWHAEPNQFLVSETQDLDPGRALDLACGEGRNAIWLAEHGWKTTGVDFSAVALAKATQFAERRNVDIQWIEADLANWEPEASSYDLVLLAYVQLPAAARTSLHRHAATALRPGGRLLVIAHDSLNLTEGIGGPQNPEVLFTPDDVLNDVESFHLNVKTAERVHRVVSTDTGDRDAIDALIHLQRPINNKEHANGNR